MNQGSFVVYGPRNNAFVSTGDSVFEINCTAISSLIPDRLLVCILPHPLLVYKTAVVLNSCLTRHLGYIRIHTHV